MKEKKKESALIKEECNCLLTKTKEPIKDTLKPPKNQPQEKSTNKRDVSSIKATKENLISDNFVKISQKEDKIEGNKTESINNTNETSVSNHANQTSEVKNESNEIDLEENEKKVIIINQCRPSKKNLNEPEKGKFF